MAERGIAVEHSKLHRWVIRLVPLLDKAFRRHKRSVGRRWRMDEPTSKSTVSGSIFSGLLTHQARQSTFC